MLYCIKKTCIVIWTSILVNHLSYFIFKAHLHWKGSMKLARKIYNKIMFTHIDFYCQLYFTDLLEQKSSRYVRHSKQSYWSIIEYDLSNANFIVTNIDLGMCHMSNEVLASSFNSTPNVLKFLKNGFRKQKAADLLFDSVRGISFALCDLTLIV